MYKKLRIACTVIATLFLVAIVPAGSIFDFMGFAVCGVGAGLFFVLMLYFKQSQLFQEEKKAKSNQTASSADETPIDETSINETSIIKTSIDGVLIIEPTAYGDNRGYFMETYQKEDFKAGGIDIDFIQDNQSMSTKGVLRGMHLPSLY